MGECPVRMVGWLVWSAENNFSWEGTTSSVESKKKKFQNRS